MARKLIKQIDVQKRHNMVFQIPKDIAPQFIEECCAQKHSLIIEYLDCGVSFRREKSNLTKDEVLSLIFDCQIQSYSFILRKTFYSHFFKELYCDYFEFCASGIKDSVEYFLWIEIEEESGYRLVEKYKLIKNDEL